MTGLGEACNALKEEIWYAVRKYKVSLRQISFDDFYREWGRWKQGRNTDEGEIINEGIAKVLSMCEPPVSLEQFEIACVVVSTSNIDAHVSFNSSQAALTELESLESKVKSALLLHFRWQICVN
jgi:hypothetical protein